MPYGYILRKAVQHGARRLAEGRGALVDGGKGRHTTHTDGQVVKADDGHVPRQGVARLTEAANGSEKAGAGRRKSSLRKANLQTDVRKYKKWVYDSTILSIQMEMRMLFYNRVGILMRGVEDGYQLQ